MREGWEILIDPPMPRRAIRFMDAMVRHMPAGALPVSAYRGGARNLMVYGPGSTRRLPVIKRHLAAGGHVAMWDLGYWDRLNSMRLSLDAMHPSAAHLSMAPAGPGRREFDLREDANPEGPIVLVGLGIKSVVAYGLQPLQWEMAKAAELARRFPGREVIWRPKGGKDIALPGLRMEHEAPITDLLRGASLVVCRHSNVAVDACVAGVPVECEDGAAAALYRGNPSPSRAERTEFLRRLSFWEWARGDAEGAWEWLERITA
jgi:hypothetical protein